MLEKIAKWINRILIIIAGAMLATMMFLTATDVIMRYLFNMPITGTSEIIEYMMASIVPFSIVYCAYEKSHVSVDLFIGRFQRNTKKIVEMFMTILSFFFVVLLTWQNILYIKETYNMRVTSAVLLIPTYPFVVPVTIGLGIFAFILFVQMSMNLVKKEN